MINVHVLDVNDPRRAALEKMMEKQAKAYEELQGGEHAEMGYGYEIWFQLGISWKSYNDYKLKGFTDEEITKIVKNKEN